MSSCIYDSNKVCDNCGDCKCDLDKNKICDNCGKCLEIDEAGYHTKAVKIDKVIIDPQNPDTNTNIHTNTNIINTAVKEDFDDSPILDDDYTNDDSEDSDDSYEKNYNNYDSSYNNNNSYDNDNSNYDNIQDGMQDNSESEVEFIDDIDGLKDVLSDEEVFDKTMYEEFPGLIRFKNKK